MIRRTRYHHLDERVREVARFDRYYEQRVREGWRRARLGDGSGAELRILQALLDAPAPCSWLGWRLHMDPGQLSRSLQRLEMDGLLTLSAEPGDRRRRWAELTAWGQAAGRDVARCQEERARQALQELPLRQQERLVRAMATIREIFSRDELANLREQLREGQGVRRRA